MLVHDAAKPMFDENGELQFSDSREVHELKAQIAGLTRELDAAKDEITKLLVHIKALKTRNAKDDTRAANRQLINEAFVIWQETCNKGRCKLREGGDRFKALRTLFADEYTLDNFRVACLGAVHNHPWGPDFAPKYRLEIETLCKGKNIELFHDAGCDWLEKNGHPVPERFNGPSTVMAQAAEWFNKANQAFIMNPDGKSATALCPVSVEEMRVELDGTKAVFQCPSGCDRDLIVNALKRKQGKT
jgi:hypothetical protein